MKLLLAIFLLPLQLLAQDITGTWKGTISTSEKELPYEIAISDSSGMLTGFSYTAFNVNGKKMVTVKSVNISNDNGRITVEDNDLVFDEFTDQAPKKVRQTDKLVLKEDNGKMSMSGKFSTKKTREFRSMEGVIYLQKQDTVTETDLIPKLEELKLAESLSFMQPEKPAITVSVKLIAPSKQDIPLTAAKPIPAVVTKAPLIKTDTKIPDLPVEVKTVALTKPAKDSVKTMVAAKPVAPVIVAKAQPPVVETKSIMPTTPIKKDPTVVATKPKPAPAVTTVATAMPVTIAPIVKAPPAKPSIPASVQVVAASKPVVKATIAPAATPNFTANLAKRTIETIQTVYFKTDSLMLTIYDNGEVDGDTVSIVLNGHMIMEKQGLSTKAINKTIYLSPEMGDSLQMVMYAENLGSLPPNTGLLIVKDGNDRYEIRFAGDLQKNAAIIFRRRK